VRARSLSIVVGSAILAAAALAGCTSAPAPSPSPTSSSPTASPSPSATLHPGVEVVPTAAPVLRPGGTADQNKLYFDAAIADYWSRFRLGASQTMVDQLVGWGFDRGTIEVTYDSTAIGLGVDSIESSVRFGTDCLVATVRADRYATTILPVTGTGTCLIGETFPVG
jgi:hypothetical protein